uniref:VQ domain-containing protein n=2 Tax=Cajanus cajan TaxID=3821 RepID=A0A151T7A7_CAJCA|nr:hypothetical protein KK1_017465 [Cajanus cajan]
MLTGSSETAKQATHSMPPMKPNKKQFKLYERRNSLKNLNIHPLSSPKPDILDFPALALSPVTPLIPDPFHPSNTTQAIKDKGYFLHPSPASTPRDAPPRLLPLFPTTSPRPSPPASSF